MTSRKRTRPTHEAPAEVKPVIEVDPKRLAEVRWDADRTGFEVALFAY